MSVILLDTNAIIQHGRAFPERVRRAVSRGDRIILPQAVKRELVDDVFDGEPPENHRRSAETIQSLIDEGVLEIREPDFAHYGDVIDEARRRIADQSLPEHHVKADQYIPAIACELAAKHQILIVTSDKKLRTTIQEIAVKRDVAANISLEDPVTVL